MSRVYLPEQSERFNKMLYDFAVKLGKTDPEEYVRNNGWKACSGGAGVKLSKKVAIDFKPCATDSKSFLYELNRPITQELYEFFKPFGVLNFDMGNARLGEVYVLDAHKKVPLLKLQGRQGTNTLRITVMSTSVAGRIKMVEIDQKLKCQITKYQIVSVAMRVKMPAGLMRLRRSSEDRTTATTSIASMRKSAYTALSVSAITMAGAICAECFYHAERIMLRNE